MSKIIHSSLLIIFIVSTIIICHIERQEIWTIQIVYLIIFSLYLYLLYNKTYTDDTIMNAGIAIRLLLITAIPSLSDDYIRFIWDGLIQHNGTNPYLYTPTALHNISRVHSALIEKMNSPDYYSVYPPVNQIIFYIATLPGMNLIYNIVILKIVIVLSDLGSFFLLKHILQNENKPGRMAMYYFINPLVIIELTGNLHFEGIMVFFILCTIALIQKRKYIFSGIMAGISILLKLIPILIIPVLIYNLKKMQQVKIITIIVIAVIIISVPYIESEHLININKSIKLYFNHFEFNGSIYYLTRKVGFLVAGYNIIQSTSIIFPMLVLTIASIIYLSKLHPYKKATYILLTYYLFATTIHPWYIIPILVFSILSGDMTGIAWSYLVFLSYTAYSMPFHEKPMIILIEYFILLTVCFYNYKSKYNLHEEAIKQSI